MKTKIKAQDFQPIELNITIENKEELLELVKRMNISCLTLNSADSDYEDCEINRMEGLWYKLNEIYKQNEHLYE